MISKNNKNHMKLYFVAHIDNHGNSTNPHFLFRKAPPSVVSGYGKRSINLNKVVAAFEKHIFFSQTDLTRTGIINNSYNEMFEA
jgi:hypothetical protein